MVLDMKKKKILQLNLGLENCWNKAPRNIIPCY